MKKAIYTTCIILIISCSNTHSRKNLKIPVYNDSLTTDSILTKTKIGFDSTLCNLNFKSGANYKIEKSKIEKIRSKLSVAYLDSTDTIEKNKLLNSATATFTKLLLNNIIPYWYGTVWDFNGYTSIPNQGTIACGYFVSTTLRDMGLNLNRYKLAQQEPENEAKSIAISQNEVLYFNEENIANQLKNLADGLFFIGLDNHVGFLYINNNNSYFLHSNYIDNKVMIENTKYSQAFNSSNYFIAKITGNKNLTEKWLKKEKIQIITK